MNNFYASVYAIEHPTQGKSIDEMLAICGERRDSSFAVVVYTNYGKFARGFEHIYEALAEEKIHVHCDIWTKHGGHWHPVEGSVAHLK